MFRSSAFVWLAHALGLAKAPTQLTETERACLARHAQGKRALVEIGVMFGASTSLLKSVMHPEGTLVGIDPHRTGRLGVSFEKWVALRELSRVPSKGTVELRPQLSFEAARELHGPFDFLFIDGDHSWKGIERDWNDWSSKMAQGGLVLLHDSRSVPFRSDHESVRFTNDVILKDPRFAVIDTADTITVVRRLPSP